MQYGTHRLRHLNRRLLLCLVWSDCLAVRLNAAGVVGVVSLTKVPQLHQCTEVTQVASLTTPSDRSSFRFKGENCSRCFRRAGTLIRTALLSVAIAVTVVVVVLAAFLSKTCDHITVFNRTRTRCLWGCLCVPSKL